MSAHTAVASAEAPSVPSTQKRLNVAVFSYGLPCPGEKRGGIEHVAHDLANALVDRGHAVTVFTYDPRPAGARYDTAPLPCRAFVMSWLGRRLTMGYLGNVLALWPGYRGFDVILAHGDSLLLPFAGKPVVRVMHGTAIEEAMTATSIGRRIMQAGVYVQELATALTQRGTVAISANTRRLNPFIHRTIPDGIDLTVFSPNPRARSATPSLLFVGALQGRKRGAWLLDRFARDIRPRVGDVELHMVTTPGPPAPGVTYHTGITPEALVRLYQRAWVYVSPSTYEGFGLPYAEALACGTPVVATPNPGSREVLEDGRYGVLSADADFSADVCRLLGDAEERRRLTQAGLGRAAQFDIVEAAARYDAVMQELTT